MERASTRRGMTARTLRALWNSRDRVDRAFRENAKNKALFLQIFQEPRGIVHALRVMNNLGILGRMLPVFRRIVGQMQHDLFHVYTVDQHILQVIRNLRRLTMPSMPMSFLNSLNSCPTLMHPGSSILLRFFSTSPRVVGAITRSLGVPRFDGLPSLS